jgi:hypothetical protein
VLVLAVLCGGFWFAVLAAGGVLFGHPIGTYLLAAVGATVTGFLILVLILVFNSK